MDVVAISNKIFMISLILFMLVFVYHGFGWKRLLIWRRVTDRSETPQEPNMLQQHAEEVRNNLRNDRPFAVFRNPLLWIALGGIAVSIAITL